MKISVNGVSLKTQVWLPTNHAAHQNLLSTWDAWYGKEFLFSNANIGSYKAWNLCSPGSAIYTELQARFSMATNVPGAVAMTDIRQYAGWGPNAIAMGNVVVPGGDPSHNYGNTAIGPMANEFAVKTETWTRHWLFMEYDPGAGWYNMSLWMADKNTGPIQVLDKIQVRPRLAGVTGPTIDGKWDILRVEYNTSSTIITGTKPMIGYVRNVVFLSPTAGQVPGLLIKPVD
jgi:hypothetical protein